MSNKPQVTSDPIVGLERTRLRLEQEVPKLQKLLLYWQTWEAEYEGFREEILALGDDHNNAELNKAEVTFEGTVLNEKERGLLLKDNKGRERSNEQILSLLSNRIRYVHENVKAVGNQLENAHKKVVASQVLGQPHVQNEEGLPLREIREELDDDGNVISSMIVNADEAAPRVAEALRKAGVNGVSETKPSADDSFLALEKQRTVEQAAQKGGEKTKGTLSKASKIDNPKGTASGQDEHLQASRKPSTKTKKGVAFAEGTKKEDAPSKKRNPFLMGYGVSSSWDIPSHTYKSAASGNTNDAKTAAKEYFPISAECANNVKEASLSGRAAAAPVLSSGNGEGASTEEALSPVVPTGESPEDALLRHQMLKYNMEDIGAVVAEIDLEDEADWSDEGDEDYDEVIGDEDDEEENDDEDEFGRTTRRVIDNKYRMGMLELERKLNLKAMQSSGREVHSGDLNKRNIGNEVVHDGEHVNRSDPSLIDQSLSNFETETRDSPSFDAPQSLRSGQPRPQCVEILTKQLSNSPQSTKKVSRFKASRKVVSAEDIITPLTPPTPALKAMAASNIVERPVPNPSPRLVVTQPNTSVISSIVETPPLPISPVGVTITESNPYTPSTSRDKKSSTIAEEPDGLDPSLLQQQVATEYHRMRNRMIQRQGGFLASAEEESSGGLVMLDEEGGGKKVSRFKAARLSRLQG